MHTWVAIRLGFIYQSVDTYGYGGWLAHGCVCSHAQPWLWRMACSWLCVLTRMRECCFCWQLQQPMVMLIMEALGRSIGVCCNSLGRSWWCCRLWKVMNLMMIVAFSIECWHLIWGWFSWLDFSWGWFLRVLAPGGGALNWRRSLMTPHLKTSHIQGDVPVISKKINRGLRVIPGLHT